MGLQPVLQIVHISDLHFKDIRSSDAKNLNIRWAGFARKVRRVVKKHDLFDWYEGVQGHYPQAPQAFSAYLENDLIPNSPEWFASTSDRPPTWLIDTGDLTTFGDKHAIQLGKDWLARWRNQLAAHESRELIGNHDAWAGCHPAYALMAPVNLILAQEELLKLSGWKREEWLTRPLVARIPGTSSRIELYALDSVCWDPERNLVAVGFIEPNLIKGLRDQVRGQSGDGVPHFRILAVHHPIVFPWSPSDIQKFGFIPVMRILDVDRVVEELNNEICDPDVGPLVHLILSGHTHAAHPASGIPGDVTEIKQGGLGDFQFQLVGGALMLNEAAIKANANQRRSTPNFSNSSIDSSFSRAQILRFYYDTARLHELMMYRIPILSVNGSIYRQGSPSRTTMYMATPKA